MEKKQTRADKRAPFLMHSMRWSISCCSKGDSKHAMSCQYSQREHWRKHEYTIANFEKKSCRFFFLLLKILFFPCHSLHMCVNNNSPGIKGGLSLWVVCHRAAVCWQYRSSVWHIVFYVRAVWTWRWNWTEKEQKLYTELYQKSHLWVVWFLSTSFTKTNEVTVALYVRSTEKYFFIFTVWKAIVL